MRGHNNWNPLLIVLKKEFVDQIAKLEIELYGASFQDKKSTYGVSIKRLSKKLDDLRKEKTRRFGTQISVSDPLPTPPVSVNDKK